MTDTKTIDVPHLGGISAGYKISEPFRRDKPTVVLINSLTTSSELYAPWLAKPELAVKVNLLAIDVLGHGKTRALKTEHWTYWDTAIMNLQVLDSFGIKKAFVLGTSQGGFVCARMALLAPDMVEGMILLGTMLDREGPEAIARGCWDVKDMGTALIKSASTPDPDFSVGESYCLSALEFGLGKHLSPEIIEQWTRIMKSNYSGEDGRKRLRMCFINLRDRDGLLSRLEDIRCPVVWMQGTEDHVFSIANAEYEIAFIGSEVKDLKVVEGGAHFLNASHPNEVEKAMLELIDKCRNRRIRL